MQQREEAEYLELNFVFGGQHCDEILKGIVRTAFWRRVLKLMLGRPA
jgi:hypothetical protein